MFNKRPTLHTYLLSKIDNSNDQTLSRYYFVLKANFEIIAMGFQTQAIYNCNIEDPDASNLHSLENTIFICLLLG